MADSRIITARHDRVQIAYETFGPAPGEPLLLITGVGMQMLEWPEAFCAALVGRGFWVARFDNRDAGLSTHLAQAGVPSLLRLLVRRGRDGPLPAGGHGRRRRGRAGRAGLALRACGRPLAGWDDRPDPGDRAS